MPTPPPDLVEAILGEAGKFCEQVLMPLNRVGDKEGCKRQPTAASTTPTGFKDAFRQIVEGGWIGISAPAGVRRPGPADDHDA